MRIETGFAWACLLGCGLALGAAPENGAAATSIPPAPFRWFEYRRELNYGWEAPVHTAEVRFKYLMDPAVMSKDFGVAGVIVQMVDDQGQSLLPKTPEPDQWNLTSSGERVGSASARLEYLGQTGRVCKTLKGSIEGTFVLATEKWELDLSHAKGQARKVGPTTITITDVQWEDKQHCRVTVDFTGPKPGKDQASLHGAVAYTVLDAQGNKWRNDSGSSDDDDDSVTSLDYSYGFYRIDQTKPAPAVKLVIDIPTAMVKEAVPFEFHDLPLP